MGNECKYEGAITIYATLEISALKKYFLQTSNLKYLRPIHSIHTNGRGKKYVI